MRLRACWCSISVYRDLDLKSQLDVLYREAIFDEGTASCPGKVSWGCRGCWPAGGRALLGGIGGAFHGGEHQR